MNNLYRVSEVKLTYETHIEREQKVKIMKSLDAYELMKNHWEQIEYRESFKIVLLNRANQVLGINTISLGGLTETTTDVRMILQAALLSNANAVVAVHNHPSGNLIPSNDDDLITSKIKKALNLLDINLIDHLIITKDGYYSYADEGKLKKH